MPRKVLHCDGIDTTDEGEVHPLIQLPVESLRKHVRACMLLRHSSDSEFEEEPKAIAPCIDISLEEEASEVEL